MIKTLLRDARELAHACEALAPPGQPPWVTALIQDSFAVTTISRARETVRKLGVPGLNRLLRLSQIALYGVEIGNAVTLGHGVYFVHTLGTVVGGDATIGDRVKFMGNNTVGTAKDNGYPIIEDDVVVGAGARILGPIRVGARSVIGANAVVLHDVPPDSIVTGVPAVARPKHP